MRYLPPALLLVLLSLPAGADSLKFAIYRLTEGDPQLLAEDQRDYTASDIDVVYWGKPDVYPTWNKSLNLSDGFSVGAYVVRQGPTDGFGLWIHHDNHPDGFSWEWFSHDHGDVFKRRPDGESVRVTFTRFDVGVEVRSIEFLTDVRMHFLEDIKRGPGVMTDEVVISQGSVLRFPE